MGRKAGYTISEDHKRKISQSMLGKVREDETKDKISDTMIEVRKIKWWGKYPENRKVKKSASVIQMGKYFNVDEVEGKTWVV